MTTSRDDVQGYLARLGIDHRPPATLATLVDLHHRHLDAVPYDNLAIMLGQISGRRPDSADPAQTLERVAAGGNAGYCFHHNGGVGLVLDELGFQAERHPASMLGEAGDSGTLDHLVLHVSGLPTDDNPGGAWWPDLGYGDGFRDPLPLRVDSFKQGPFNYRITKLAATGWTFRNDPKASSIGSLIGPAGVAQADVDAAHARLSGPGGAFTRLLVVQRRDAAGAETLRGIRHTRVGERPFARPLRTYDAWREVLVHLGVCLAGVEETDLRELHRRMLRS